jgi:hypothetical protein
VNRSDPLPATFLRRALAYAHATGVRFEPTLRHAGYGALGLPDLRGFTPYRRAIRRFAGEEAGFPRAADTPMDELATDELWLLHDLLHVVWYDFAALAADRDDCAKSGVGRASATRHPDDAPLRSWSRRDFFVEQHLASEAFAVILLDYHVLSATRHRGLAVEVSDEAWTKLRAALPELPPLRSRELASELVRHYLTGRSRLFRSSPRSNEDGAGKQGRREAPGATAALASWRDHEVRYAGKQRGYVLLWWDDLRRAKPSKRAAVVERSSVAEPLWRAVELLTVAPDAEFADHVDQAATALRDRDHLFAELPKFRGPPPDEPDFRLTDIQSLPADMIKELVRTAERPCAERLFLLWQTLALEPPTSLKPAERAAVASLARSVQTPRVDRRAWKLVRDLCERRVARARWRPDDSLRGAFFLP